MIATWMLEQLLPGRHNEALAGDLLEEFGHGRSAGWYWRQVLSAFATGLCEKIACHRGMLLFALLWSAIAPAWIDITAPGKFPGIAESIRHIDWPWSSVCTISLSLGPRLAFIWAGILVYLLVAFVRKAHIGLRQIGIGLLRSLLVFLPIWAGSCAITLLVSPLSHLPDWQIVMPAITAFAVRLPSFATVLWALWGAVLTKSRNGARPA